jgi:hypothetical protein
MSKYFILATALLLGACTPPTKFVYQDPIPALDEQVKAPCPVLAPIKDGAVATLSTALNDTSALYVDCKNGKKAVVDSYETVRQRQLDLLKKKPVK